MLWIISLFLLLINLLTIILRKRTKKQEDCQSLPSICCAKLYKVELYWWNLEVVVLVVVMVVVMLMIITMMVGNLLKEGLGAPRRSSSRSASIRSSSWAGPS